MKILINILVGLICVSGIALTNSEIKTDYTLTNKEARFLNTLFEKQRKDFDFQEKMVAYSSGTSGTQIEDKLAFFDRYLENVTHRNDCSLVLLTKEEKEKSGGFDIVIMSPAKLFTKKHREILIGGLRKLSKSYAKKNKYKEPENANLNKVFLVNSISLFKGYYYQGSDSEFHYFISKWDYQKDKLIKLKLTDLNVLHQFRYGIKEVRVSIMTSEIKFGNNQSGTLYRQH
jgi:hypothetical protein